MWYVRTKRNSAGKQHQVDNEHTKKWNNAKNRKRRGD